MNYRKVCVVGPGAIGGMMAVMLERAGFEVSALARPKKASAINSRGITLLYKGETLNARPKASSDPAELGLQDLVIVTLKSNALVSVAPHLKPLCKVDTPLVMAMNGVPWWFFDDFGGNLSGTPLNSVDPDGVLSQLIPREQLIWAVITCSVSDLQDGTLEHTHGQGLTLGRPTDHPAGVEVVADVLRQANYKCAISGSIRQDIWSKLLANVSLNPISALGMAMCNEVLEDPLVRECVKAVAEEAQAVANCLGLDSDLSIIDRMRDARVKTSMLQDLERGRPLELGSIIEAVVEIAEHTNVPVPQLRAILGLMRLRAKTAGLT
ncbi:MAG TPA: 2-dehydropantoate 2-reductase [Rhodospirillaceae bacterium]|nr:2-dehydropantoate 2-reductase [Candidatus Neomarinimicrobiota bacterium]HCX14591.1 2-dehydropantoate 2-reductase [Rhodospirillaceae bacterium]